MKRRSVRKYTKRQEKVVEKHSPAYYQVGLLLCILAFAAGYFLFRPTVVSKTHVTPTPTPSACYVTPTPAVDTH